jgi:hypothetical protein
MELFSVGAADDHGESVFETERLGNVEIETLSVALFDALVDGLRVGIVSGRFAEDGGEGGAGVFDVEIEIAGEKGFLAEERAAEIGFAVDVDAGAGFDMLGEEFGEDDLLGEEFGADGDVRLGWAAAGEAEHTREQKKDCAAHGWECLTVLVEGKSGREKITQRHGERRDYAEKTK